MKQGMAVLLALSVLTACGSGGVPGDGAATPSPSLRPDVVVTSVRLGRALEPDRRVADESDVFGPADTVYASIVTEGSARRGSLGVRWTSENGDVLAESSLDIAPAGTTVSEFHISKPDGLPRGAYALEVFLDGVSAAKRRFSVR